MFRFFVVSALAAILFAPAEGHAQSSLEGRVKEYRLKNGLHLIVLQRSGAPTFAAYIRFLVGGVDEQTGQAGVAHILEHMLFKGSKRIGTADWKKEEPLIAKVEKLGAAYDAEKLKGAKADPKKLDTLKADLQKALDAERKFIRGDEISEIYQSNGGQGFNAFTAQDTTTYLIKLPANRFELWAWMEADRLKEPVLREYYAERDVIMEERRRSVDNSPEGTLYENFLAAAFTAHPYQTPIIGWASDIDYMPLGAVKSFLKTYYSPNNMVVCIVGDLDPDYVYKTVDRYFAKIPPQVIPPRVTTVEPPQIGERRVTVRFDAKPQAIIGFHKPVREGNIDYVFDVIDYILTHGRTSRFYKSLVLEQGIAASVSGWEGPGRRYPNLYMLQAVPREPHTLAEMETAIYAEMDRLKTVPLTKEELEKVINNVEAGYLRGLQSNSGIAHYMSEYAVIEGDWREMVRYVDNIRKVTPEDVMAAANKYFTPENRTVATLAPLKKDAAQ
ncbi:MAG: insulinase family protein [Nitrospinae bacterium]|nr:insulinase family protein [Nitrospinota bacterium]